MARRPTILDVAKQAGVSKSTVSLVLQGSDTVKSTTRDAVRKAMSEIGYVYNRSAATLRSASSGLIGLVINDMRNPFFTEFAASLQMSLAEQNYATVIANTDESPQLQCKMISSLLEHGVSGLIISPAYGNEKDTLSTIATAATPTIQVLRRLDEHNSQFPFLAPDYRHGSALATQHLMDIGCKKIAFLGGLDGRPVTRERMSGYLAKLADNGIEPLILTGQATRSFGKSKLRQLLSEHPDLDGILCFNDLVAFGVLSASAEQGLAVGTELHVVGIDDTEDCLDTFPSLTSVNCNIPALAHTAASSMLAWIHDGCVPDFDDRSPVSLIKRASSGAKVD